MRTCGGGKRGTETRSAAISGIRPERSSQYPVEKIGDFGVESLVHGVAVESHGPGESTSGLQLDQHLVIAMVVDIPRRVGVAALAEVDLAGLQSQPRDAARAGDFQSTALDRIEKVVVVMMVLLDALAGLQREF